MFTYVKVGNYRSLGELWFDLTDKTNQPKNLVVVYGKNGIGKSNLLTIFQLLCETFTTLDRKELLESIANDLENLDDYFLESFKSHIQDMKAIIHNNKLVDSNNNMIVEFGFKLDGKDGKYIIETNDTEIVYEKLEYVLTVRKGTYFEFGRGKKHLNSKVFLDSGCNATLLEEVQKYWGKHTFLAILLHELKTKNEDYYKENIISSLNNIINFLRGVSYRVSYGGSSDECKPAVLANNIGDIFSGIISEKHEDVLQEKEEMLNGFLCRVFDDIKKVYYRKKVVKRGINYQLMIRKNIQGCIRDIDYRMESTGATKLIAILPHLIHACNGGVAVIDEFDVSIDEVLSKQLLMSLYSHVDGQIILTSHNTLLMDKSIPRNCFYGMRVEEDGSKTVKCMLDYNNKIGDKNKMQNLYYSKILGVGETEEELKDLFDFKVEPLVSSKD